MELVSVVMPAYNASRFIAESIQSVQNQTYTNWELIIVDDGSTDNTYEIAANFAAADKRIKIKQQKNSGVSSARNLALDCARGGYIAFLDADDLWDKEFLAAVVARADKGANFVYSFTKVISEKENWQTRMLQSTVVEGYLESFVRNNSRICMVFQTSAILIRRSLLEECGLRFNIAYDNYEDTCFYIQLACITPIVCVNKPLSIYRELENSLSHRPWIPDEKIANVRMFNDILPYVKRYRPQIMTVVNAIYYYNSYIFLNNCVKYGFFAMARQAVIEFKEQLLGFCHSVDEKAGRRLRCLLYIKFKNYDWLMKFVSKL